MNSLTQFFVFVFKAIFYRNKQIPKKQLEYLFYTAVRRFSIFEGGRGVTNRGIDRFIGGVRGGTMHFKIIGGGGLAPAAHPAPTHRFYWSLLQTNVIFTFALSCFTFTSITESISSDHYHFHVDRSTSLYSALAFSLSL